MKHDARMLFFFLTVCIAVPATIAMGDSGNPPRVVMETSKGAMVIELDSKAAPVTVSNFLGYIQSGFYNGTIFHRVIKGFMIQGGGFTADMQEKPAGKPIPNEASNGLKNAAGTIAMARTQAPHSATSQFFINTVDNAFLDHTAQTPSGWGYCVFGRVVEGMEVVRSIETVAIASRAGHQNVPVEPVRIIRAFVVEQSAPKVQPNLPTH